jgi:hypothetical protein
MRGSISPPSWNGKAQSGNPDAQVSHANQTDASSPNPSAVARGTSPASACGKSLLEAYCRTGAPAIVPSLSEEPVPASA